jgi:stage IV sporulation protein B
MSRKIKKRYRFALLILLCLVFSLMALTVGRVSYEYAEERRQAEASLSYDKDYKVWPSGEAIGIYVKTRGVMVIDVGAFETGEGCLVSPCEGLLEKGDYIEKINGEVIKNKNDFTERIEKNGDGGIVLSVVRDDEELTISVNAYKSSEGTYKLGLWVKDDIAGIGTLTFVDENGFAALGHSINDNETGEMFQISEGAIYNAKIVNIVKPKDGIPGKLEGIINYAAKNMIGRVETNESDGISGYITDNFMIADMVADETAAGSTGYSEGENEVDDCDMGWVYLGTRKEVTTGKAYIISCVSGERCAYSIEIEKVNRDVNQNEKNMEIRVTDERLLALTGGIVQGMSGSPIIQDGKLVGAVTHVFVNDSTKGYGIFIENMIEH